MPGSASHGTASRVTFSTQVPQFMLVAENEINLLAKRTFLYYYLWIPFVNFKRM